MAKKILIAIIIAAVVLLGSAGFIYAYNNERNRANQYGYSPEYGTQDQGICQQERNEWRYQYNNDGEGICQQECNEYRYQNQKNCEYQGQQVRKQERSEQGEQCEQLQLPRNQQRSAQQGFKGRR